MQRGAVVSAVVLLLAGCPSVGIPGKNLVSSPSGGSCSEDLGADAAAQKVEAFLAASASYKATAEGVSTKLVEACTSMGAELGVEVQGDDPKSACGAVAAKIEEEAKAVREAKVKARLDVVPPQCNVQAEAFASCAAECDVNVEPGQVELACEGGELRGGCSAECSGSCSVAASAKCEGMCEGQCEGTCSAKDASGACAGSCDGTCKGQCVAEVKGSCQGQCRGGCSVEFTEPVCTGSFKPPNVSAECQASCDARLSAEVSCTPAEVSFALEGDLKGDMEARAAKLKAALEAGLPAVLALQVQLEKLAASGQVMLELSSDMPAAAAQAGLQAAACVKDAVAELSASVPKVAVSAEVSVKLSASVGAG